LAKSRISKPYSYPTDIPDTVKNQSPGVQKAFIAAFNSAYREAISAGKSVSTAESAGRQAGWANVKRNYYRESDGRWQPKKSRDPLLDNYPTFGGLPHDVKQLPTVGVKLWAETYNASKARTFQKKCDEAWAVVKKLFYTDGMTWRYKKRTHGRSRPMAREIQKALESHRMKEKLRFDVGENEMTPKSKIEKRRKGFFKMFIPFETEKREGGQFVKVQERDGKKFLKGIASNNLMDRDEEAMSVNFVRKMASQLPNLPVFVEHEHHLSTTIGFVSAAKGFDKKVGEENVTFVSAETCLEPEFDPTTTLGNKWVSDILMKVEHGTPLGYSVAGYVTEWDHVHNDAIGKDVPTVMDGEIDELSITARPSARMADGSLVSFTKAIKELQKAQSEKDESEIEKTEGDDRFVKFAHSSKLAPSGVPIWGAVNKERLPRIAHARMGEPNEKSTWGYPHHHVVGAGGLNDIGVWTQGKLYLHRGGVIAAWSAAMGGRTGQKAEAGVISHINRHRKTLKLDKMLAREGFEKCVDASFESVLEDFNMRRSLLKAFKAQGIDLEKLRKEEAKPKAMTKAVASVYAEVAGKVVRELYGMEPWQK